MNGKTPSEQWFALKLARAEKRKAFWKWMGREAAAFAVGVIFCAILWTTAAGCFLAYDFVSSTNKLKAQVATMHEEIRAIKDAEETARRFDLTTPNGRCD